MKRILLCLLLMTFAICYSGKNPNKGKTSSGSLPGLYVQDGVLMKDGKPYYGMGINYFDLFVRRVDYIPNAPVDRLNDLDAFAALKGNVPFIRLAMSPFRVKGWKDTYLADKCAYFAEMDIIVRKAEELDIGLIPSLMWNFAMLADVVTPTGHMIDFTNDDSALCCFICTYTEEVVTRYLHSPAIWGWEFGNEFNIKCNIPNGAPQNIANPDPTKDVLKVEQMQNAFKNFVQTVRRFDNSRPVFSGNAMPRSSVWHNINEEKWTPDNREQYTSVMRSHESYMNTMTTHIYYSFLPDKPNTFPLGIRTFEEYVALAKEVADNECKPLFVGEFGVSDAWLQPSSITDKIQIMDVRSLMMQYITGIVDNKVPLSCVWNYDRLNDGAEGWNITYDNSRSYMIDMIKEANKDLAKTGAK